MENSQIILTNFIDTAKAQGTMTKFELRGALKVLALSLGMDEQTAQDFVETAV